MQGLQRDKKRERERERKGKRERDTERARTRKRGRKRGKEKRMRKCNFFFSKDLDKPFEGMIDMKAPVGMTDMS